MREKILAQISRRVVIMVDESKLSPQIGTRMPVPVEVVPFGLRSVAIYLKSLGAGIIVRRNSDKSLFKTDQGNVIIDCNFGPISEPDRLALRLGQQAGIVEHGLFLSLATDVIVAGMKGIRHLKPRRTRIF